MYNLDSSRGSVDDVMSGKTQKVQDQRERSREEGEEFARLYRSYEYNKVFYSVAFDDTVVPMIELSATLAA